MRLSIREVSLAHIQLDETRRPAGPRLIQSLREFGQLVPIHVRALADGMHAVPDGSRRVDGARVLEWNTLTAVVEPDGGDALDRDKLTLILNRERKNLEQLYTARHVRRLMARGDQTQAALARELHIHKSCLCLMLKVLACPDLEAAVEYDGLEWSAAVALVGLLAHDRKDLLTEIRRFGAANGRLPTVRRVKELVAARQGKPALGPSTVEALRSAIEEGQARGVPIAVEFAGTRNRGLEILVRVPEAHRAWISTATHGGAG